MIRSKMNSKILLNLLLISMFSLVCGSEQPNQPKKSGILDGIRFTNNQPKTLVPTSSSLTPPQPAVMEGSTPAKDNSAEQQAKIDTEVKRRKKANEIDQHLDQIQKEQETGFVLVKKLEEPTPAQPVLTEPTPALVQSNKLGDPYPCPTLPEQNKTTYTPAGFLSRETMEDILNRIIEAGEFKAAHTTQSGKKQYAKINEDSGEVLTTHVATITAMLKQQSTEKTELFSKHRSALTTALNRLRLLIKANQEPYAKGSINQQRIENALAELQEAQKTQENANDPLIAELNALEIALHETRKELLKLHPTADKQPQIPNRRMINILPAPTTK